MAMTLREAARRAERDVDAHALLAAGVLRRNADGKIEFPLTRCTWIHAQGGVRLDIAGCCAILAGSITSSFPWSSIRGQRKDDAY
jgi:hypothetical protein